MTPAEFCRDLENYLCRKNDGHLIRIVGPVFTKVCDWAAQGVPLKVAYQGIDRYFERRQAKGPAASRRPARIEFCEADILDAFDAWRRAVGVAAGAPTAPTPGSAPAHADAGAPAVGDVESSERTDAPRRKTGLHTHIDRVMARLTQRRVEAGVSSGLADVIDRLLGELDALRARAKGARHESRADVAAQLQRLDETLIAASRTMLEPEMWTAAEREAREDLESSRGRMDPAVYDTAWQAATARAFRARARLPVVRVEE